MPKDNSLGPLDPIFDVDKSTGAIVIGNSYPVTPVTEPVYATLEFVGSVTNAVTLNGPVGIVASGDILVTAFGASSTDGAVTIDASDPTNPVILSSDPDTNFNGPASVDLIDSTHAIVTCGANLGRISTIDFTDPSAAVLFDGTDDDSTNFFNDLLGVVVIGSNAFIAGAGRLGTMDVSNPGAPNFTNVATDASTYATGRRTIVTVDSTHVAAAGNARVSIVDVSAPNSPVVVGSLVNSTVFSAAAPEAIDVDGDILVALDDSTDYFSVVDISDLSNPQLLGSLDLDPPITAGKRDVRIIGNYAVAACLSTILLIDITDRANPVVIDQYPDVGTVGNAQYLCQFRSDMVAISEVSNDAITILRLTP